MAQSRTRSALLIVALTLIVAGAVGTWWFGQAAEIRFGAKWSRGLTLFLLSPYVGAFLFALFGRRHAIGTIVTLMTIGAVVATGFVVLTTAQVPWTVALLPAGQWALLAVGLFLWRQQARMRPVIGRTPE
jgi:hypothetical protein